MKKIVLLGATGMIGKLILDECLNDSDVEEVISFVRKKTATNHSKLVEIVVADFADYRSYSSYLKDVDCAFFCIGVYTGSVSKDVFKEITINYPVNFAKVLKQYSPDAVFCLLSGQGADRSEKSNILFANAKGKAENQISAMSFKRFHAFRPGYIYPVVKRKEPNVTYQLMRFLYPLIRRAKNISMTSTGLAHAMYNIGKGTDKSITQEIIENSDLKVYDETN